MDLGFRAGVPLGTVNTACGFSPRELVISYLICHSPDVMHDGADIA
jgi:hypothetical protein